METEFGPNERRRSPATVRPPQYERGNARTFALEYPGGHYA